MKLKIEEKIIAPCGMDCALCIAYQGMHIDLNKEGFNRTYCPGCIPRGENCLHMKDKCDLVGKGTVRFCYECKDFPCTRLKALDKRYRTKYHLSMIENLIFIRDQGMQAFLEQETSKWTCPECGGLICCHNGLCLNCDLDILKLNRKYRWGER